jgi:uncharacterized protein (TIGR00730 family)
MINAPSAPHTASPLNDKSPIEQKQMTFAEREANFSWQVLRIMAEFVDGFEFLTRLRRTVTFFGSARVSESEPYYQLARALGKRLAEEQYTIVTGGGPGIMEAGNRGAAEGGGLSVGLNIELPLEQRLNSYVKHGMGFHYFFSRKFMLDYSAMAYVYFPGGYGTLDELFTVLTMVQTGKTDAAVPIILMGSEYWSPLADWLKHSLAERHFISAGDLRMLKITDEIEEAVQIICSAGERAEGGG